MTHVNAIIVTAGRQARSYPIAYISDDEQAERYAQERRDHYAEINAKRTVSVLPIESETLKALW